MSEFLPSGPPPLPAPVQAPLPPAPRNPSDDADSASDSIDLKESLAVLRRHLWLIAFIVAASVAVTGYRLHHTRPQYQANAVIRLVDARRQLAGDLDNSGGMQAMSGSWTDPIESQLQVLRSRGVAAGVVDSQPLGLRLQTAAFPASLLANVTLAPDAPLDTLRVEFGDRGVIVHAGDTIARAAYGAPVAIRGVGFTVTSHPPHGAAEGTLYVISRTAAIDMLVGGIRARQRERTDVVDVSYTSYDPYVAQQVADAVVTVFQSVNAERAQEQSRRRRVFVETQLKQTDSILQVAQDNLSRYREAKQVYGSDAVLSAEQTGLLNLDVQRQELAADRQVYQSLLGTLHTSNAAERGKAMRALVASPGIAQNPVVQADYQQLVLYQTALDSLSVGRWASAPTSPEVERLTTLVGATQVRLGDAVESQITSLDARIAALDELRQRNAEAMQKLPATEAGEARLVEQLESTRKMEDELRDEYQKARIDEAVEAGQVEIVDLATSPYAPIGTTRKMKLLTGTIVGLLLGLAGAFLVERLNTAILRREDIESVLQVPGLAIIPKIAGGAENRRLRLGSLSLPLPIARRYASRQNGASLVTVSDVRSSSAEAFRTLRTNLIFSQAVQTLRTIVITSPSPQDGKTTTAANLAVTFAQQGMRVVIVDCDLRRARLHHIFHLSREPGLTQLLLDHADPERAIRSTAVENLFVLPAGAIPPNPSELLGGAQMRSVVEMLKGAYDVVILDTPPVHVAADSMILGSLSDGAILVLRAGHTERAAAQDALHRLASVGVRVVGAVLNDPDHKVPQYGGYYYYDYYSADEPEGQEA